MVAMVTVISGCATAMSLPRLVDEGAQDELLAMEKYEGKRLAVRGIVADRGLQDFDRETTKATFSPYYGGGQVMATGHTYKTRGRVPYVDLSDDFALLRCYFDEGDRSAVAEISPGDDVTLVGDLRSFNGSRVVFWDCSVQ